MNSAVPSRPSLGSLLFRHSPKLLMTAVALGALAGALYGLVIPFVLAALRNPGQLPAAQGASAFFGLCLLVLVAKAGSIILINNIAKAATGKLRVDIAARVGKLPVAEVENLGMARLFNVLVDDVNRVAGAAVAIPMALVSGVTVLGMLAYLATLDLAIFALVLGAIVIGVAMFQLPMGYAGRFYRAARDLRDTVQEGVRGLVQGAFELKLDQGKAARYLDEEIAQPQRGAVRLDQLGDTLMHVAGTASDLLAFFVIGLVVYVLPQYVPAPEATRYGVVMALLYISAPVAAILALLPHIRTGQIALERIVELFGYVEEAPGIGGADFSGWREISAHGLGYSYPDAGGRGFTVGPVDLHFQRGQVNFIVGGNGSGKTTLSKLLSLHYQPSLGELRVDGKAVDGANIGCLRRHVAVIYSNYYLFRKLYRPLSGRESALVADWLDLLGLSGKTEFVDGQFTTTKLSDGQRRRLALLVALLDERDIYVFDEWAADQDPGFKRAFYQHFLPQMKRDGKLVLVISHDDRYFDCADRLILMESGRVREIRDNAAVTSHPAPAPEAELAASA